MQIFGNLTATVEKLYGVAVSEWKEVKDWLALAGASGNTVMDRIRVMLRSSREDGERTGQDKGYRRGFEIGNSMGREQGRKEGLEQGRKAAADENFTNLRFFGRDISEWEEILHWIEENGVGLFLPTETLKQRLERIVKRRESKADGAGFDRGLGVGRSDALVRAGPDVPHRLILHTADGAERTIVVARAPQHLVVVPVLPCAPRFYALVEDMIGPRAIKTRTYEYDKRGELPNELHYREVL
jgi:hypothetical protein